MNLSSRTYIVFTKTAKSHFSANTNKSDFPPILQKRFFIKITKSVFLIKEIKFFVKKKSHFFCQNHFFRQNRKLGFLTINKNEFPTKKALLGFLPKTTKSCFPHNCKIKFSHQNSKQYNQTYKIKI